MKTKINLGSFIFSFVCIVLFFISTSSSSIIEVVTNLLHIHPLNIVLIMSVVTLLFGFIGFTEVNNGESLLRSILTIVITFILSAITAAILLMAEWIPFT